MATLFGNASFVANSESWSDKIRDAADGPGGAPYIDGRLLGTYLAPATKVATFEFQESITKIPNAAGTLTTITGADDVEVSVGFDPLLAVLLVDPNPDEAVVATGIANTLIYLKFAGMDDFTGTLGGTAGTLTTNLRKMGIKLINDPQAGTNGVQSVTFIDNVMTFNRLNPATASDGSVVTIHNQVIDATNESLHRLFVIGK